MDDHSSAKHELIEAIDAVSITLRGDLGRLSPPITTQRAMQLTGCPWDGDCFPACPHCSATSDEIDEAHAWLNAHPQEAPSADRH